MRKFLGIMAMALSLAACGSGGDDFGGGNNNGGNGGGGKEESTLTWAETISNLSTVEIIQHSGVDNGFPIVIMADGYTADEIADGTYKAAVQKATNALFAVEPMKSLKGKCDVIMVKAPSEDNKIDTRKRNTAFRTYVAPGNSTDVYGDSIAIQVCAFKGLVQHYNIQTQEAADRIINKALTLVLLKNGDYKGVTLLGDGAVSADSIPNGFSLSYVPVNATYNGRDVFTDLVQHEGVGHGIAKLGDEYSYNTTATIAPAALEKFETGQKIGFYMNVKYDNAATADHAIEEGHWLYPFTQRPEYDGEGLAWHKGAFEFSKQFFRPTVYSTMNATTDPANKSFNVASRAMIYKRVKRETQGNAWTFDIDEFVQFDIPGRDEWNANMAAAPQEAKGMAPAATADGAPVHTAPKIVKFNKIMFNK